MPKPHVVKQIPRSNTTHKGTNFLDEMAALIEKWREGGGGPANPASASEEDDSEQGIIDEDPFVDATEVEDRRNRSKKVYYLTANATDMTEKIPPRPSACRRVFRYLQKYEVGTVKQMSHSMNLEKKTIGNALAALKGVKLVDASELPKNQ
jgi:hypothetical protein